MATKNFRNLDQIDVSLAEGINIIVGKNAQGKTNFIESVWMLTGGKTFRGHKNTDLVKFGETEAFIKSRVHFENRLQDIEIDFKNGKRYAKINDIEYGTASNIIGKVRAMIFAPTHLSIVKEGPENRRNMIDAAICQLRPAYNALVIRYNKTLKNRNFLLKSIKFNSKLLETLEVWDKKLIEYGIMMEEQRKKYLVDFIPIAQENYKGISENHEKMSIKYKRSWSTDFEKELHKSRDTDILLGYTSIGPHRDDMEIFLDDKPIKIYGSQGQQKSCALSLKLAEAYVMYKKSGEKPIILLDDVMSELDFSRQSYIVSKIRGWQVFITTCDLSVIEQFSKSTDASKIFHMDNGKFL